MKRFLIVTDRTEAYHADALTAWLQTLNVGWWHYLASLWLVANWDDTLSVEVIAEKIHEINPFAYCMVFDIPDRLAGKGYGAQEMFDWINTVYNQ